MSNLVWVSSPAKLDLRSFYDGGFSTYVSYTDRQQPPIGTPVFQSIILQVSPWNVVDLDATAWLPTWLSNYASDPLLSQIAINEDVFPPPYAPPGTVFPPQ